MTPLALVVFASNFDDGYQADVVFRSGNNIRAQGSNWWQMIIVHELGHALNLEHPFEGEDGDVYGSEYSTSLDETIMAYGSPSEWGRYHEWFTQIDVEALHSIWGLRKDIRRSFERLITLVRIID